MNFPLDAPVAPEKLNALKERLLALKVDLSQVKASYIRCPGPGGQKVNKTSSGVYLKYPPLDIAVKWTRERSRALNRFLALRELADEIEARLFPDTASRLTKEQKIARQKARRQRRSSSAVRAEKSMDIKTNAQKEEENNE